MRDSFVRRRQRPLVQEVRDELERMILSGDLSPGERLNEISLAEQMAVSRGPVREAARSLEKEGLVTAVANQGVFVRELSAEAALELYDLRAMIAGYLCGRVAQSGDAEVKAALRDDVARMDELIAEGDEERYFEANLAFHDRIAEGAGAGRAQALYTSLGKEVRLLRLRVLRGPVHLRLSNAEHHAIVDAILRRDTDAAIAAGAAHHANGKNRLLDTLSRSMDRAGKVAHLNRVSQSREI